MDEALEAYEKALAAQDASNLTDALLQTIHPATTDADLFISPTNDRAKLNGGANHFDVIIDNHSSVLNILWYNLASSRQPLRSHTVKSYHTLKMVVLRPYPPVIYLLK